MVELSSIDKLSTSLIRQYNIAGSRKEKAKTLFL